MKEPSEKKKGADPLAPSSETVKELQVQYTPMSKLFNSDMEKMK